MHPTKVLVTGSSGSLGRFVVAKLLAHGYQVTGTDLHPADHRPFFRADLCDLGQTIGVAAGHDTIIHLAAIPTPSQDPPEVVFRNNMMSTFNVMEAAVKLGIRKVVWASSVSAFGIAWRFRDFNPTYVPIDEDHPLLPQDCYGLSKSLGEELAAGFTRREPTLSITSLRFTLIATDDFYRDSLPALRNTPENSNSSWGYVDIRDAARACRLAAEYTEPGHSPFYIVYPDTYMDEPTVDLLKRYHPGIPTIKAGFGGHMSVFDPTRAERLLGFRAEQHWKQPDSTR